MSNKPTHYTIPVYCENCERVHLEKRIKYGEKVSEVSCDYCGCKSLVVKQVPVMKHGVMGGFGGLDQYIKNGRRVNTDPGCVELPYQVFKKEKEKDYICSYHQGLGYSPIVEGLGVKNCKYCHRYGISV